MTINTLYPALKPSLLMDFANSQVVNPQVTFSRASTATYVDKYGNWQEAANNQGRVDFDPVTNECKGLLIESQGTNSVSNPRGEGFTAGTPGTQPSDWGLVGGSSGLSREILSSVTENNITYVRVRYFGTTTTALTLLPSITSLTSIAASPGQTWTQSAFMALVINSGATPSIRMCNRETQSNGTSNNATDAGAPVLALTSTPQRFVRTTTMIPLTAFVTPNFRIVHLLNESYDYTVWWGWPQMELSSQVSSPILPPVGAPATSTRAVESLITTSIGSWFNNTTGTIVVQAATLASGTQPVVTFDDNTVNEQMVLNTIGTDPKFTVTDGGVAQADLNGGTISANTTYKMAAAYTVNDFAACVNGGTVQTDASGTIPTVDRMRIGTDVSANQLVGYIKRIAYYPERLTNAQLQALTL